MPLPNEGSDWPPEAATRHGAAVREWSAWYSGDPEQLAAFYRPRTGRVAKPAQYAGGVVGTLARWWWGTPASVGEQEAKLHVPLAADICGTSADLLFSEPLTLTSESKALTEFLEGQQESGLEVKLHEGAEVQAALGGVYLRTMWDSTVQGTPWTSVVHPDGAVPEFRYGRLVAVNLWTDLGGDGSARYRHVERHERGFIVHALFKGTDTNLGKRAPLESHPVTAGLPVNDEGAQATGTNRLTVTYVPNMLPNRLDRHSAQGRSDLHGVTPLLDALDEAYSSWWRDIRHAKARIHVPSQYMLSDGPGTAGTVDIDREVYVPLEGVLSKPDGGLLIEAQQFDIRWAEHLETCKAWTERAVESAGYSTQSLSSGTGGAVTAAEVHSHERRSYMTRGKKARYWTLALREHLLTQAEVANANLGARLELADVRVSFPDGVQESTMTLAGTAQMLRNAEAASIETRVQLVNPDWDQETVDAEVVKIMAETGAGVPMVDPDAMGSTGGTDASDVKARADAMGVLIRAGVEPDEAAERVGLPGVEFTGAMPTSLRLPAKDAAGLEDV